MSSEVIILMGTLALVSAFGSLLMVSKICDLFSSSETFVTMSCLHLPIMYNLFLPAIIGKYNL